MNDSPFHDDPWGYTIRILHGLVVVVLVMLGLLYLAKSTMPHELFAGVCLFTVLGLAAYRL